MKPLSDADMLRSIHNMSRGEPEPEYNNRKERRAAESRKRRLQKKKFQTYSHGPEVTN